jgi:hypothetical protein
MIWNNKSFGGGGGGADLHQKLAMTLNHTDWTALNSSCPKYSSWMLQIPFLHELLKDPIIIIITHVKNRSSGDLKP